MLESFPQASLSQASPTMLFNVGSIPVNPNVPTQSLSALSSPAISSASQTSTVPLVVPQEYSPLVTADSSKSVSLVNITREELVLRRIFDDTTIQHRIMEHLDPEIFTGPYKDICKAILAFHSRYKRFPPAQDLILGLPDDSIERTYLSRLMSYGIDTVSSDVSAAMVKSYFREMLTEQIIIESAVNMKNRKIDNMVDLVKKLEKTINFNLDVNVGLSARSDMPEIVKRLNQTLVAIPSAIYDIRKETANEDDSAVKPDSGGWYRTSLSVLMGMPNVGKTVMLCNEAAFAYSSGYNVLYVSLEMSEEFIHQRIISNVCKIPMKQVRKRSPEEILREYEKNLEPGTQRPGNVVVRRLPTSTTVVEIENLIREVERTHGYKVDILFVDYLGIMKPVKRANTVQNMNLYTMGKEVAEQLRDLADLYKIPVVTASQLNREGYSSLEVGMEKVAGSAGINDVADLMITIMQDPLLKELGMYMHTILKSRFGSNGQSFYTSVDFTHMRVRSVSDEQRQKYSDRLASQPQLINKFNTKRPTVVTLTPEQSKKNDDVLGKFDKTKSSIPEMERKML